MHAIRLSQSITLHSEVPLVLLSLGDDFLQPKPLLGEHLQSFLGRNDHTAFADFSDCHTGSHWAR